MKNKYENIEVIDLCDITELPDLIMNSFSETGSSMCFISDRESVEYTMIELFKNDCVAADSVFLFDSVYPMFVGMDQDGKLTVDDIEEEWFLNYDVAFIDLEADISQETIDKCLEKNINVFLVGREDDNSCCGECLDDCNDKCQLDTDHIHGFNISFSDENKSYDFKFYSSSEICKDDILSILEDINL